MTIKWVHAGDIIVSNNDTLYAIYGSCVGVLLVDRINGTCGLSHGKIPYGLGRMSCECSTSALIHEFFRMSNPKDIDAYLIGGASVVNINIYNIAQENISITKQIIIDNGLKIKKEFVGGNVTRRVSISPLSGFIEIKNIKKS